MPEAILIAGPNGAGKTTMARQLLKAAHPGAVFLNADEIQREGTSLSHPVAAGRALLARLEHHSSELHNFAIQTTLSSDAHARRVPHWKALGYVVVLHFIELPTEDLAVARVARRVAAGGHDIPEVDIRRRFRRGGVDEWYHWRSDDQPPKLIDSGPG